MRTATRSTLLWLMSRGMSLPQCTEYTEERIRQIETAEDAEREMARLEKRSPRVKLSYLNKKPDEIARLLVNGCAQYTVAERLAEEWEFLGSEIRMKFTDQANAGWRSGNKTKGLIRADKMLGGKIFRHERAERTAYDEFHKVGRNEARSGIAYKFVALPPDYHTWPASRKKKYREQLARERRSQNYPQ